MTERKFIGVIGTVYSKSTATRMTREMTVIEMAEWLIASRDYFSQAIKFECWDEEDVIEIRIDVYSTDNKSVPFSEIVIRKA